MARLLLAALAALLLSFSVVLANAAPPAAGDPAIDARRRAALPRLPEPDHRRLARGPGRGPAQRGAHDAAPRQERCRNREVHDRPLRRLRPLPPAREVHHLAAMVRPRRTAGRRPGHPG